MSWFSVVEVNSSGKFIYTQVVIGILKRENKIMQTPENLRGETTVQRERFHWCQKIIVGAQDSIIDFIILDLILYTEGGDWFL